MAGGIPLPCPPGMILPGMKPRMLAARRWVEQPASKRGPAYWKGRALRKGRTRWQCGSQLRMTAGTDRPRGTAHMPRPDGVGVGLGEITPSRRVRSSTRPAAQWGSSPPRGGSCSADQCRKLRAYRGRTALPYGQLAHEDALPQHGGREQVRLLRCSPLYPGEGENYGHPIQRSTDALHKVREASALRSETALL